jgi:intracellular septation protein A
MLDFDGFNQRMKANDEYWRKEYEHRDRQKKEEQQYNNNNSRSGTHAGSSSGIGVLVVLGIIGYLIYRFIKAYWVSIVTILGIGVVCAIICFILYKKARKAKLKMLIAILVAAGLIGVILFSGHEKTESFFVNLQEMIPMKSHTIIKKGQFENQKLQSVTIPDSITSIRDRAFMGNEIISLEIPNNVKSIGNEAFRENKLDIVSIPFSVKSIGVNAFADNPVISVIIGPKVKLGSDENGSDILGQSTGFNTAYTNNGRKAGTYTRPDINSTTWTRR